MTVHATLKYPELRNIKMEFDIVKYLHYSVFLHP